MKQKLFYLLLMAAALTIGFTACSDKDDEEPQEDPDEEYRDEYYKFFVSLTVNYDLEIAYTRTDESLQSVRPVMHAGDRLFVHASPKGNGFCSISGYLSLVPGTLSADGRSAQFSGTLTLVNTIIEGKNEDFPFTSDDYLSECNVETFHVPGTAGDAFSFSESNNDRIETYWYDMNLCLDQGIYCVEKIVESALRVRSDKYDAAKKTVYSFRSDPMVQIQLSGIHEGEYFVNIGVSGKDDDYSNADYTMACSMGDYHRYIPTLNVPKTQIVTFAIAVPSSTYHCCLGLRATQNNREYGFYLGKLSPAKSEVLVTKLEK